MRIESNQQTRRSTVQIRYVNRSIVVFRQMISIFSRYNGVRGWDIRCTLIDETDGASVDPRRDDIRAPWIYSPIDGEAIGRIRLRQNDTKYDGCDNDGLFIVGTGAWQGM